MEHLDNEIDQYMENDFTPKPQKQFSIEKLTLKTAETLHYVRNSDILYKPTVIKFLEIVYHGLTEFIETKNTGKLDTELKEFKETFKLINSRETPLRTLYRYFFCYKDDDITLIKLKLLRLSFSSNRDNLWSVFYANRRHGSTENLINETFKLLV